MEEAIERGDLEKTISYLQEGEDVYLAFYFAAKHGQIKIVKFLLEEKGVEIKKDKNFAFGHASQYGHLEVVKYLWEKGVDIRANNGYAVRMASENGHLEVVKFLWEKGAIIHAANNWAFYFACLFDRFDIMKFLWEKGADISRVTPQHRKFFLLCEKINKKRQVEAANKIGRWWIPICYDTKRECGKRMMERGWEKMYK